MNKVNVYGSFTQALLFSGTASVPRYLLNHYNDLGLNNLEMLLIIHILSELDSNANPSLDLLAQRMKMTNTEVENMIENLKERNLISVEQYWDNSDQCWYNNFSFIGLIEELAERWAIGQMRQYEKETIQKDNQQDPNNQSQPDLKLQKLVDIFEQELGRPLTGLECEHITNWLSAHFSEEIIIEALRRGVSAGIRNFRYLDSILREWEKKNLRTKAEIELDDANFQARQQKKNATKLNQDKKTPPEKYENFYL
ncbi:MAG TPA: DnaD domain protein [Desulfitobacteriaceae bacterium]|jgi:DNA replication protein|nr:DnaD domain protein [Desulfitobacteriaceae bacterium]